MTYPTFALYTTGPSAIPIQPGSNESIKFASSSSSSRSAVCSVQRFQLDKGQKAILFRL